MAYYVSSTFNANVAEGPLTIRAGVSGANVDRAIRLAKAAAADDATLIAFYVLGIGALIGVIGASVGLRNYLRT